jgi:Fe-S-cluster containining protein
VRDELAEELIQIVDAALADAVRRSGSWLACRPGCSQCCYGVFEITAVDGARLRVGMAELEASDPERAAAVTLRVVAARERLEPWYPGDVITGVLTGTEEEIELFEEFAHADACPALDPATGRCDLYAHRPILCRTFGPPIRNEDGDEGELGMCELNFVGANEEQVLAGEMSSAFREAEAEANQVYAEDHPGCGGMIVAFALGPMRGMGLPLIAR